MNNLKNPLNLYQQGTGQGGANLYMTIDEPYDKKDGEYVSKDVAEELLDANKLGKNALENIIPLIPKHQKEAIQIATNFLSAINESIKKATE